MPLYFPPEPLNGAVIVEEHLRWLLSTSPHPKVRKVPAGAVRIRTPHAAFDLKIAAVANGGGLETASTAGVRYLVEVDAQPWAAAELRPGATRASSRSVSVNIGPYVRASSAALVLLAKHSALSSDAYEPRLLRCRHFAWAIWLKSTTSGSDRVYTLAPVRTAGLVADTIVGADEFIAILRPQIQQQLSHKGFS